MAVGRVGTNYQDDVAILNAVEILRSGTGPKSGFQTVASRRVANPRAGIDIVIAKTGSNQFLHEEGFFVGAAA